MSVLKSFAILAIGLTLAGCSYGPDKSIDRGFDSKHLSQLKAGIWIDPQGCDQWIIDDGVEGYLSARLDKYGKPVCSGLVKPETAYGPFKRGTDVPDIL